MKPLHKLSIPLLAVSLLMGSTTAWAGKIEQATIGTDNQILGDVTTVTGRGEPGEANGPVAEALFLSPWSIAAMPDGTIVIADSKNHLIRKVSSDTVSEFAGITFNKDAYDNPIGGLSDGKAGEAVFGQPKGITTDQKGNLYIADSDNHAIRRIDSAGLVTTIAGNGLTGSIDGKGQTATFHSPQDVAVADDGTIYVADTLNHAIRVITPSGVVSTLNALSTRVVEVVPGQAVTSGDYKDGDLKTALFNEPAGLVIDPKGNLYVSDTGNQLIRYIDLSAGKVTTVAGLLPVINGSLYEQGALYASGDLIDGDASKAQFNFPKGLAITDQGGLLIADSLNHSIRYLKDNVVYTLAGDRDGLSGFTDGAERSAGLQNPTDIAVASDGSIWIADSYNNKIRKLSFYELPQDISNDGVVKVLNGTQRIVFEAQPENVNGRVLVPVRAITEALGYTVTYKEDVVTGVRTVRLSKGSISVELTIGIQEIKRIAPNVADVIKPIDIAPYIKNDLTYVPVRFFAEELGQNVQWHQDTQTVIIR